MFSKRRERMIKGCIVLTLAIASQSFAAISLDRTRVVIDGGEKSVSLSLSNDNKQLPFLAQGWIEDAKGTKIVTPLTVLPPVQRIEPGEKSQIKIQTLPGIEKLPQNIESLYYFNLREIPPRTNKSNALQIALQTRVKLFYRPTSLVPKKGATPWQQNITLEKKGEFYSVINPTPYYVTIVDGAASINAKSATGFIPVMIEPHGKAQINVKKNLLGNSPVLTYVNDYGARPKLKFECKNNSCAATPVK